MLAKISYDDRSGQQQTMQVRQGQRLSIGSSFSADIVLGSTQGVASEHAEISLKNNRLSIRNLTGRPDSVIVNGSPTTKPKTKLGDGDSIEIGTNGLLVSFPDGQLSQARTRVGSVVAAPVVGAVADNAAKPATAELAPAETESEKQTFPQFQRHENGIAVVTVKSFRSSIHPMMTTAQSPWNYHLICNHRRSKSTQPPPETQNYFESQAANITDSNDLYLLPLEDRSAIAEPWSNYIARDAGLIGLTSSEEQSNSVAEQLKFLATWFMVPSTLKFHLINGSSLLLNKVFGMFDLLVISDVNGGDLLLTNDPAVDSHASLLDKIRDAKGVEG